MAKASLTSNPLARPSSPIYALAKEFGEYMHFPDPSPLYALMGAMAGNMIAGNTVWLMLVGPASCGKTTLLNSLQAIPRVYGISSINGPGVLLSGTSRKETAKDATGGILRQIGDRGCLFIKEFGSVLTTPEPALSQTLTALREVYDGRWARPVGTDGGHNLLWEGRIGVVAGCTEAIDQHHQVINELGERWIFYRYPPSDAWGETMAALGNRDPNRSEQQLAGIVSGFFSALNLDWTDQPRREFSEPEKMRLYALARFSSQCRSTVPRDRYTREVSNMSQVERAPRLATCLGQLYLGMELLGLRAAECWRVVSKVALDCLPQLRRTVWETSLKSHYKSMDSTLDDFEQSTRCSLTTVKRVVQDLEIVGMLERVPGKKLWRPSKWAAQEYKRGFR